MKRSGHRSRRMREEKEQKTYKLISGLEVDR